MRARSPRRMETAACGAAWMSWCFLTEEQGGAPSAARKGEPMKKIIGTGVLAGAVCALCLADNIFQEKIPPGGPYKLENPSNWSTKALTDPGNWFLDGTATVDKQTGSLTIDPQDEKGGFFIGRQGRDGALNMSGGELTILSSVNMGHTGGKGSLNLTGGRLLIEGNLALAGKAIHVGGGVLHVGSTLNSQVSEFLYTGGKIICGNFGISSGRFDFRIGPDITAVETRRLFGEGVLTLSIAEGYEIPADQEIVLFTFSSDEKMAWSDGQGVQWKDGETVNFSGKAFTVVRKKDRLAVVLQFAYLVG